VLGSGQTRSDYVHGFQFDGRAFSGPAASVCRLLAPESKPSPSPNLGGMAGLAPVGSPPTRPVKRSCGEGRPDAGRAWAGWAYEPTLFVDRACLAADITGEATEHLISKVRLISRLGL